MEADLLEQAKNRYEQLQPAVSAIRAMPYWLDLRRMKAHCNKLSDEISKESVVCRQRKKVTVKYNELVNKYVEAVDVIEKYTMLAHLSGG
jgi:hypothetical protein